MRKKKRACLIWMVMAFVLLAEGPGFEAMAAENETGMTKPITATFVYWTPVSWDVDYSDDYFLLPSDQYHHKLAQLSCGLALSAFRDTNHKDAQDDNLISFLQDAGFEDIDTHPYKDDATWYSVACGIGHKKIGDTKVVALAVCGGNYHALFEEKRRQDGIFRSLPSGTGRMCSCSPSAKYRCGTFSRPIRF